MGIARDLKTLAKTYNKYTPFMYQETSLEDFYKRMFFLGIVVDNNDPTNTGRVKVQLPEFDIENNVTWAKPGYTIFRTTGTFIVPDVGDTLFVFFRNGRPDECYYISSIYTPREKPASTENYKQDDVHVLYHSKNNNYLRIIDNGENRWTIMTTDGPYIEIQGKEQRIEVVVPEKYKMILDGKNDKLALLRTEQSQLEMNDPSMYVYMSGPKIVIVAKEKVQIKAPKIELNPRSVDVQKED